MFYKNLKKFIKKFTPLWKFLTWSMDCLIILSRLKDVLMMMILFHVWPEQTYRFSTRKVLPRKENRFSKESKPFIPYDFLADKGSNIAKMKEINVIGRGSSFNLNNIQKISGPIFLIAFWNSLKVNSSNEIYYKHYLSYETGKFVNTKKTWTTKDFDDYLFYQLSNTEYKKKNITYVISRPKVIEFLKKNGHNVLSIDVYKMNKEGKYFSGLSNFLSLIDNDQCKYISVVEKVYKTPMLDPHPDLVPTGSFLPALCALSFFAEKVNVYGWDSHLDSSPENMGYWKLLFNMYHYNVDRQWNAQFEHVLINFYYGYQLSKLPNINIYGYMGHLDKHEKLIKKIERVLFN